jgi:release factor glutamine methyltransferase
LLISNPPYISTSDLERLQPEIRNWESSYALDGGPDGLDAYRILLRDGKRFLNPAGDFILEIGYNQTEGLIRLAREHHWHLVKIKLDYNGLPRLVHLKPE